MKKLAVFTSNPGDATSWYRCFGPIGHLRQRVDFEPTMIMDVNWATLSMVDAVMMHRPDSVQHVQIARKAKYLGKKLWLDFDDDLTNIPMGHPCFEHYQKNKNYIVEMIQLADVVTSSTTELAKVLSQWNENVRVVPNAVNEWILPNKNPKDEKVTSILWRGSDTHFWDLKTYDNEIVKVLNDFPEVHMYFMGMWPRFIEKISGRRAHVFGSMDILEYFHNLYLINPDIMIVPLEDTKFNRSKSNIAWIEGTMAGAAVLTPEWENWPKLSHTYSYASPASFEQSLRNMLVGSKGLLSDSQLESEKYIIENLTLDKVNLQRAEVLEELW